MAVSTAVLIISITVFVLGSATSANDNDPLDFLDDKAPTVTEDVTWPGFPYLKQVNAVAVDGGGNLHIFHRADRVWDGSTFNTDFTLVDTKQGPIPNDTVLVVDTNSGKVLKSWGANSFYMPHGMTIDRHGNTWVTDVGLHQMLRFPAGNSSPDLTFGEALIPGAGIKHLCQPTDVAILPNGNYFVSDGYCNSRILMFHRGGRLLRVIGAKDGMDIPHSLTLVPEHNAVCVADRENGRILCYATGSHGTIPGTKLASIENHGLVRVFAIDTRGNQLFVLNGFDMTENSQSVTANHGLVFDIDSGLPNTIWGPDMGFIYPHDLAVSPDRKYVYVSEIDVNAPKKVYKFSIWD